MRPRMNVPRTLFLTILALALVTSAFAQGGPGGPGGGPRQGGQFPRGGKGSTGQRRLVPVGRLSQTDDGGNFRIFGLAPGDYYLSATLRNGMFADTDPTNRSGYAPTYFPGTGSSQQAEHVTVGLGGEAGGVSFSLLPVRTAKITGTAV